MSEERRKRRQDGESGGPKKNMGLYYVGVLILVAGAFLGGRYYRNHKYDSFAKCVAGKNARMYGMFWCSHCAEQKREFGASFQYVPYVECASKDNSHELTPACKAAGVTKFPSWQFGSEPPKARVLSLQELSEMTGCSLP